MRSMAYVLLMVFVGQGTLKGLGADTWVGETQFFLNGCIMNKIFSKSAFDIGTYICRFSITTPIKPRAISL